MSSYYRPNRYCADLDRPIDEIIELAAIPKPRRQLLLGTHIALTVNPYLDKVAAYGRDCHDWGLPALQNNPTVGGDQLLRHLQARQAAGVKSLVLLTICTAVSTFYITHQLLRPHSRKLAAFCHSIRKNHTTVRATQITPAQKKLMVRATVKHKRRRAARDRAALLLLFVSAMRPKEFCRLRVQDLTWCHDGRGLILSIPQSKGDQDGKGQTVTITSAVDPFFDPISALRDWLDLAQLEEGVIFRVIDRCDLIGADKAMSYSCFRKWHNAYHRIAGVTGRATGYSDRRGWARAAREAGATRDDIRQHLRHKRAETSDIYIGDIPIPYERSITGILLS